MLFPLKSCSKLKVVSQLNANSYHLRCNILPSRHCLLSKVSHACFSIFLLNDNCELHFCKVSKARQGPSYTAGYKHTTLFAASSQETIATQYNSNVLVLLIRAICQIAAEAKSGTQCPCCGHNLNKGEKNENQIKKICEQQARTQCSSSKKEKVTN